MIQSIKLLNEQYSIQGDGLKCSTKLANQNFIFEQSLKIKIKKRDGNYINTSQGKQNQLDLRDDDVKDQILKQAKVTFEKLLSTNKAQKQKQTEYINQTKKQETQKVAYDFQLLFNRFKVQKEVKNISHTTAQIISPEIHPNKKVNKFKDEKEINKQVMNNSPSKNQKFLPQKKNYWFTKNKQIINVSRKNSQAISVWKLLQNLLRDHPYLKKKNFKIQNNILHISEQDVKILKGYTINLSQKIVINSKNYYQIQNQQQIRQEQQDNNCKQTKSFYNKKYYQITPKRY